MCSFSSPGLMAIRSTMRPDSDPRTRRCQPGIADRFRADSDFDLRHYIAFSGTWELPFYKMWSSGPTRLTKGWTLYPIITFRTGAPMTIFSGLSTQSTDPGPSGAGDQGLILANQVNSVTYFNPKQTQTLDNPNIGGTASGNYWFNPGCFLGRFLVPAAGTVHLWQLRAQ